MSSNYLIYSALVLLCFSFIQCAILQEAKEAKEAKEANENLSRVRKETKIIAPCDCDGMKCGRVGRTGARVVGGTEAIMGQYPSLARLSYRGKLYCGASLINKHFLLTAAHCIKDVNLSRVTISIGSFNKSNFHEPTRNERLVKEWWHHPGFDRKTFNNDIGLILLNEPVTYNSNVMPICVDGSGRDYTGLKGIVPGWGKTEERGETSDTVREVRVPIMSNEDCKNTKYRSHEITDNMMCAGYSKGKIDACQGDSGGPLILNNKNEKGEEIMELIGIVSWGQGCAREGYPGVYTRVSKYMNFINEKMGSTCFCPRE